MVDKDEQQTDKSSAKPYTVTYTTQDFALRQSGNQDLVPSSKPLCFSAKPVSTTKALLSNYSPDSGNNQELKFQCLNTGTNHTYGKVIRSGDPNVSLHLTGNNSEGVPTGNTIANFDCREESSRLSQLVEVEEEIALIEDDWIVLNPVPKVFAVQKAANNTPLTATKPIHQMALNETEQNLIKASWVPMREDPETAGLLLFDGLFTKYPKYLSYFSQFSIDMGSMKENKLLTLHAKKVIEKVTYVVDALGNEAMTSQLNEALVKLVRSHLKKKIGLDEFTNLGEVLIDFICFVNYHGLARAYAASQLKEETVDCQLIDNSDAANKNNKDDHSDTMTSILEKIQVSSTSSSSSDDGSYLASVAQSSGGGGIGGVGNINSNETMTSCADRLATDCSDGNNDIKLRNLVSEDNSRGHQNNKETKLDFNVLVPAWRTLYKGVKDLVRQEEDAAAEASKSPLC